MSLKGLETVLKNLNNEILSIQNRTMAGLIESVILIQTATETRPPLVPIGKTGNLHNSWSSKPSERSTKEKPEIEFGYSANYASHVHEMKKANFKRPGAGAKWFQYHLKSEKENILKILRDNVKIK